MAKTLATTRRILLWGWNIGTKTGDMSTIVLVACFYAFYNSNTDINMPKMTQNRKNKVKMTKI